MIRKSTTKGTFPRMDIASRVMLQPPKHIFVNLCFSGEFRVLHPPLDKNYVSTWLQYERGKPLAITPLSDIPHTFTCVWRRNTGHLSTALERNARVTEIIPRETHARATHGQTSFPQRQLLAVKKQESPRV